MSGSEGANVDTSSKMNVLVLPKACRKKKRGHPPVVEGSPTVQRPLVGEDLPAITASSPSPVFWVDR